MFQFGCCLPVTSFVPQIEKEESQAVDPIAMIEKGMLLLKEHGYDFVELTVGTLTNLSKEDFHRLKEMIFNIGIPVHVFNSFIPPDIKITGPEVSYEDIKEFVGLVMHRVKEVGGKCIIFGSGGARSFPEGFSKEEANQQIVKFLHICSEYALENGLVVAIEPLNTKESNIINTVEEAFQLAKEGELPNIKVLADSYHMIAEKEKPDILGSVVKENLLAHVHVANRRRYFPGLNAQGDKEFIEFFEGLYKSGYSGKVSAECRFDDFSHESKVSLDYVKSLSMSISARYT